MVKKKITVSIIVVHYKAKNALYACLSKLRELIKKTTVGYEVIIIDNDEDKIIENEVRKIFSFAKYIKTLSNKGYGGGNNLGAEKARGEFLFFLNPDTILLDGAIDSLATFLDENKNVGIVAPILLDKAGKPYQLQGVGDLNPLSAIFTLSFVGKFFPENSIYKTYWNLDWDMKKERKVNVVPGTAFMIRTVIFRKIKGFDENFFLFFEEFDLCKRVRNMGYNIYMLPKAKVIHYWGESTKYRKDTDIIFARSRFLYFKKYFGIIPAFAVDIFLRFFKPLNILLLAILGFSIFLNTYRLSEQMIFIGDQGWFYLSARDLLLTGKIPLVGITASHTWLHQGPLWTYILALIFWLFKFNPVAPAYFTAFLSSITVLLVYKVGKILFSKNVGLIGVVLYATSPLVIINSRMPYHTSPIPLLTLGLIYSVFKWIKGNVYFFPIIIFLMALLYNFELATQIFWFPIGFIFVIGFIEKKKWAKAVLRARILFTSLAFFILPMLPIIIYDINHKFVQTIKFFAWVPYRASGSLLADLDKSFIPMLSFFWDSYKNLIFISSSAISLLIILLSLGYMIYFLLSNKNGKNFFSEINVLLIFIIIPMIGFLVNMTPSGAYLPLFFPSVIIATAWIFDKIMNERYLLFPTTILISLIVISNALFSLDAARNKSAYGLYLTERLNAVETMLKETGGEDYVIRGEGPGSQFESFTMNYEYLAWWLGKPPSKEFAKNLFIISESKNGIIVNKEIINK